jgi:hypothetical protein
MNRAARLVGVRMQVAPPPRITRVQQAGRLAPDTLPTCDSIQPDSILFLFLGRG